MIRRSFGHNNVTLEQIRGGNSKDDGGMEGGGGPAPIEKHIGCFDVTVQNRGSVVMQIREALQDLPGILLRKVLWDGAGAPQESEQAAPTHVLHVNVDEVLLLHSPIVLHNVVVLAIAKQLDFLHDSGWPIRQVQLFDSNDLPFDHVLAPVHTTKSARANGISPEQPYLFWGRGTRSSISSSHVKKN